MKKSELRKGQLAKSTEGSARSRAGSGMDPIVEDLLFSDRPMLRRPLPDSGGEAAPAPDTLRQEESR